MEIATVLPARTVPEGRLRLVEYTDPYSVWCWGCEPALRRIEYRYGDSVSVEYRMGGLFEDFTPMREYWTRMSGGRWKESVTAFLTAVAGQHRMPINATGMLEGLDDFRSTYPACVAVKAAELQGRDRGRRYLRRLREAVLVEGRAIHRRTVQIEVASEAGLTWTAFARAVDDGSAERAFREDLEECRAQGVTGFPTFALSRGYVGLRIEGFRSWDALEDALRNLDPDLRPRPVQPNGPSALDLLRRYGRCATREVAAVLGLTDDETEILLDELAARREVQRRELGDGLFWELPRAAAEARV